MNNTIGNWPKKWVRYRTFWACTGCSRNYRSERWGLKHLTTGHDGAAWLNEFSPELQQRLIETSPVIKQRLKDMLA